MRSSRLYAAAYYYALMDPTNMKVIEEMEQHCQDELCTVLQRPCIRNIILLKGYDESSPAGLLVAIGTFRMGTVRHQTCRTKGGGFLTFKAYLAPFNSQTYKLNAETMSAQEWWKLFDQASLKLASRLMQQNVIGPCMAR